jgi:hypothetical protein
MKLDKRIRKALMRRANGDLRVAKSWQTYIDFLEARPRLPAHTEGSEVHHILWRADYPKFIKSTWNTIRLSHNDHTAAASLALAAEPDNGSLRTGFKATYEMSGSSTRWIPQNPQEVIRLYQDGWSPVKLGAKYDVSSSSITRFLRRNGTRTRNNHEAHRWTPGDPVEVIRLYVEEKLSRTQIGRKYGVNEDTIRKFLLRSKVKLHTRGEAQTWKPEDPAEVIRLYRDEEWSAKRVGSKFGLLSCVAVLRFLRDSGVRIRANGESRRWNPKDPKEVKRLYLQEKWDAKRIARKFHTTWKAVARSLVREGVKMRTRSETHATDMLSPVTRKRMSDGQRRRWKRRKNAA